MLLKDLIKEIEIEHIQGDSNIRITGVAYDSRKVKQGNLFVCIKGFKVDGHSYISQAIENGAVCIIVEQEITSVSIPTIQVENSRYALAMISAALYEYPSSKLKLIGVTGTNGKTTSTYLIKAMLELQGKKVGLIGTNQNMIGDQVLPTERTTPESLELQELFSEMVKQGVEMVVMEVSSHSLALNRVDGCQFDIGVFTNLTQDHLDFHGSMEKYLIAKTKLFQQCKIGIINVDDDSSEFILKNGTCKMISFGIENKADVRAKDIDVSEKGVRFQVESMHGQEKIMLRIPGLFSVYNALGSIAACLELGLNLDQIQKGLAIAKGVPGRAQVVRTGKDYTIIIDYAHTPDGLENIIQTVKDFAKGRVVTLFGCGGDRDNGKRPIMGEVAGRISDFCIVTSDNPRTENPMQIINQILEGIKDTDCPYVMIENRYDAIEYALSNAQKDDVIILAGKGHETYQEINGLKYPFDEKEIVQKILGKKTVEG